jgi:hypothetical protein
MAMEKNRATLGIVVVIVNYLQSENVCRLTHSTEDLVNEVTIEHQGHSEDEGAHHSSVVSTSSRMPSVGFIFNINFS